MNQVLLNCFCHSVFENLQIALSQDWVVQVAEGVSTAGAVIALAQKYKVKMPVLTAVARIIDNELTPQKAVRELMNLPQVCPTHQRF